MAAATYLTDSAGNVIFVGGILKAGTIAAPSNVTVGDITGTRAHIGTDAAFTTDMSFEVNAIQMYQGGTIATATGGSGGFNYGAQFNPIMTGGSNLIGMGISATFRPATAPANYTMGMRSLPLTDPPNGVTVPTAYGWALGLQTGSTAGGAITNTVGALISIIYGSQKPTNTFGVDIANAGSAGITLAVGLQITGPSAATNNYAMSIAGAGTTTHAGGAWGAAPTGWIDILVDNIARRLYFV